MFEELNDLRTRTSVSSASDKWHDHCSLRGCNGQSIPRAKQNQHFVLTKIEPQSLWIRELSLLRTIKRESKKSTQDDHGTRRFKAETLKHRNIAREECRRTCDGSMNYGSVLKLDRNCFVVQFHQKPANNSKSPLRNQSANNSNPSKRESGKIK